MTNHPLLKGATCDQKCLPAYVPTFIRITERWYRDGTYTVQIVGEEEEMVYWHGLPPFVRFECPDWELTKEIE